MQRSEPPAPFITQSFRGEHVGIFFTSNIISMALSRAVLDLNKKAFDPRGLVSHAAQAIYLHYDL